MKKLTDTQRIERLEGIVSIFEVSLAEYSSAIAAAAAIFDAIPGEYDLGAVYALIDEWRENPIVKRAMKAAE